MAFFFDQRQRLLREENWTAHALAQEVFGMMSPDVPMNTESAVKVSLPTGATVAPYQVGNFQDGNPVMSFTKPDGSAGPTLTLDGGQWFVNGKPMAAPPTPAAPSGSGSTFAGKIISGGPGDTYQVTLYPAGKSGAAGATVSVTQLQIDAAETIPANTWTAVWRRADGGYEMQVPVWV